MTVMPAVSVAIRTCFPDRRGDGWNEKMSTRLNMALQRLEAAVNALEIKALVPSETGADKPSQIEDGEIRAIRELVDQALQMLTEEDEAAKARGGVPHD
jgi:hypothetical protein